MGGGDGGRWVMVVSGCGWLMVVVGGGRLVRGCCCGCW